MRPASKVQVVIYSRPGCHLCDDAKKVILQSNCSNKFTLSEINIENDPELLRRYKYDIPVVTINGVEEFRHRLTSESFKRKLNAALDSID
jgi:glutaredoxin